LDSIQALRAFAATSVVIHHVFLENTIGSLRSPTQVIPPQSLVEMGAIGVDVFFVISGFLMTYISEPYFSRKRSAGDFLLQRLIRIWPPYALVTIVACIVAYHRGWPFDLRPYRLASFLFIPSFDQSGRLQPIVGPGWTLNYEMLFYVCFAITILLGRGQALLKLAGIITLLFVAGSLAPAGGVFHTFFGDPILFEFVAGAAIGFALKNGRMQPRHGLVWIAAAAALLALLFALGLRGTETYQRLLAWGLPSAMVFIGFVALEEQVTWPRSVLFLGNASYSIYLTHILVIYPFAWHILRYSRMFGNEGIIAVSLVTAGAAVVAGCVFYVLVERPLLRACQRLCNGFVARRTSPPLVAQ
jgi:peptidoglycan/LPS O-acetylase OafA/YrhL